MILFLLMFLEKDIITFELEAFNLKFMASLPNPENKGTATAPILAIAKSKLHFLEKEA